MIYIFFTFDGGILPVAERLKREGNSVHVCQIENTDDVGVKTWITSEHEKKPEVRRRRMSIYSGLLKKTPLRVMMGNLARLSKEQRDRCFVVFDHNTLYKISEKVLAMGYEKGLMPTKEDYDREHDRKKAKEFVHKNYPGISRNEQKEFKSIDELLKFILSTKDVWVVKSDGNFGETVVPGSNDPATSQAEVKDALTLEKADYSKGKLIAERKIPDAIEFAPEMVFWNGKYVYSQVELETRMFGAEDLGPQTGGNQNVVIATREDDPVNQLAFPPAARALAKGRKGMFILDAGILSDGERYYFTEYAGDRWGWGGVFSEMAAAADGGKTCTNYFESVMAGRSPYRHDVGASLAVYNLKADTKFPGLGEDGKLVIISEKGWENSALCQVKLENGRLATVGYCDYDIGPLGYMTGRGNSLREAVESVFKNLKELHIKGMYYRPKSDFLSDNYISSIKRRYDFLVSRKLIKPLAGGF